VSVKFVFRASFVAVLLAGVVLGGVGSSAEVEAGRLSVNLGGVCVREGARDKVAGKRVVCVLNVKKQLRWRLVKATTVRVVTGTTTSTSVVSTTTVAPTTTVAITTSTSASSSSTTSSTSTTTSSSSTSTSTSVVGGDRMAPVVTLGRSTGSSVVATLTFTVTGNEPIVCSTLSGSEGVDFRFTRISRINSIVQTTEDVCTISVQSTAEPGDTNPRESSLAAASTFSVSDTAGNSQTTLSGSPQTIWVQRIARPVISLSATTETVNQNVAMNGYTVTSTGGTVASYSLTGTLPAGVSFSTTTGRITGTPTASQTATTYTITATNTSGSTTATFTLTVVRTCANGGECIVGNTGPGGGKVFYVSADNFLSTGSDCNTACKYFEAAPTGWGNGITVADGETSGTSTVDPRLKWCSIDRTQRNELTKTAIGDGRPNTTTSTRGVGACTTGAIFHAELYAGNGKTDWHLPSRDELNQLRINRVVLGSLPNVGNEQWWSSSEIGEGNAWNQNFFDGNTTGVTGKGFALYVRPVRAFG
jgi:hypothetical protein